MSECSCGKVYESQTGIDYCQYNNHGRGKDTFGDKFRFKNELDAPEITVVCSCCTEPLRGYLRVIEGNVEVNVLPHVCQIEESNEGKEKVV